MVPEPVADRWRVYWRTVSGVQFAIVTTRASAMLYRNLLRNRRDLANLIVEEWVEP